MPECNTTVVSKDVVVQCPVRTCENVERQKPQQGSVTQSNKNLVYVVWGLFTRDFLWVTISERVDRHKTDVHAA